MIINPIKKRREEKRREGVNPGGLGSPGGSLSNIYFSI